MNDLNCPIHKFDVYTRYCYTDQKVICEKCADADPDKVMVPVQGQQVDAQSNKSKGSNENQS